MATQNNSNSGIWRWLIIALLVAVLAMGIIYYLGWFDNKDHVDTPAGDNVEQDYPLTGERADSPGEANWENNDSRSLDQIIVDPDNQQADANQ